MYEQFRGELLVKLSNLNAATVKTILQAVDDVAVGYKIEKKSTDLIVYQHGLPDVCKAYLVSRAIEGVAAKSIKLYTNVLTMFFKSITIPINKIQTNDIRVWLYRYEERHKICKRTLNLYRMIINGFFCWAAAEGVTASNPCSQIKPIKYRKRQKHAMSQIELEYIRQACTSPLETAIIELFYSTGCRVSEMSTIKLSDVNWEKREVTLLGKGDKIRTAYLNAKAIVALQKYLNMRHDDSEALIVTTHAPHNAITRSGLQYIIKRITKRVQDKLLVHVTPHVIRHTTATHAVANGMPIQDVQAMLGHSNINTTMIYAETLMDEVKSKHSTCII